jgi:MerR family transcriptional regulator, light-induced transcriptional regulator
MSVQQYVDRLSNDFGDSQVILSGYQVVTKDMELADNVKILPSLDDTIEFIENINVSSFAKSILNHQNSQN